MKIKVNTCQQLKPYWKFSISKNRGNTDPIPKFAVISVRFMFVLYALLISKVTKWRMKQANCFFLHNKKNQIITRK